MDTSIARALVSQPQFVLADEPTAALDSKSGRGVVEIMQRLALIARMHNFIGNSR